MHNKCNFNIHNKFDIEVFDTSSQRIINKITAYNVVCDTFWTRLLGGVQYFQYIHYGDGVGTPSSSDSTLFNRIGAVAVTAHATSINYDTGVAYCTKKIILDEQTAVGKVLSEVGIGYNNTECLTHAKLQDEDGQDITITKTNTMIVTIYATIYIHWPIEGWDNGKIRIETGQILYSTSYFMSWLLGNTGSNYTPRCPLYLCNGNRISDTYWSESSTEISIENKSITFKYPRWDVNTANHQVIKSLWAVPFKFDTGGKFFTDNYLLTENIGTGDGETTAFATGFPIKSNLKVYIDDIQTTDFTYRSLAPNLTSYLATYLEEYSLDSTLNNIKRINTFSLGPSGGYMIGGSSVKGEYKDLAIFYNPYYETIGIKRFYHPINKSITGPTNGSGSSIWFYASNDMENWVKVNSSSLYVWSDRSGVDSKSSVSVPTEYQHYKYFKLNGQFNHAAGYTTYYGYGLAYILAEPADDWNGDLQHNIIFNTPPTEGASISVTYNTDIIPKNTDSVFDFSFTIQFS